jgi:hypothetical protein
VVTKNSSAEVQRVSNQGRRVLRLVPSRGCVSLGRHYVGIPRDLPTKLWRLPQTSHLVGIFYLRAAYAAAFRTARGVSIKRSRAKIEAGKRQPRTHGVDVSSSVIYSGFACASDIKRQTTQIVPTTMTSIPHSLTTTTPSTPKSPQLLAGSPAQCSSFSSFLCHLPSISSLRHTRFKVVFSLEIRTRLSS